jgi:hypothetical protein
MFSDDGLTRWQLLLAEKWTSPERPSPLLGQLATRATQKGSGGIG